MGLHIHAAEVQPVVALLAGVVILLIPRSVSYIVGAYLLFDGVVSLGLIH